MSLSLDLYRIPLSKNACMIVLVHFYPQLELVLSPFDTVSNAVDLVGGQTLGIKLLNSFGHQYQM